VEKISDEENSIVRKYSIETSSHRTLAMVQQGGRNSSSIGPSFMWDEEVGKSDVTVTVVLEEDGGEAVAKANMLEERNWEKGNDSRRDTVRWEEKVPVPPGSTLSSLLTETGDIAEATGKTVILRIESNGEYLELNVE
jgi:hypothetical protein